MARLYVHARGEYYTNFVPLFDGHYTYLDF